jgi:antitoxin PrlF
MKEFVATISRKGQVTIPANVRRQLGVGAAADQVAFVVTGAGTVQLRPVRFTLDTVLGSIDAMPDESVDLDREIAEAVGDGITRKVRRWSGRRSFWAPTSCCAPSRARPTPRSSG